MDKSVRITGIILLATAPFVLYAICMLLPTFDDWTYITSPYMGELLNPERLCPNENYWRPFDGLFGYILGLYPQLFPTLNHICIFTGHLACTYVVYLIGKRIGFKSFSLIVSILFFYLSPATLGTVYNIDSMNQVYSQFWGLAALYFFLEKTGKKRYLLYGTAVMIATLCKENGLAWSIIPPVFAFGFYHQLYPIQKISNGRRCSQVTTHVLIAVAIVIVYFFLRYILRYSSITLEDNEYLQFTLLDKVKDFMEFIVYTWIPVDYVSLFHQPSRNIMIVTITAVFTFPCILYMLYAGRKNMLTRPFLTSTVCWILAASPHLLTIFSLMHSYAGLSMAAIMLGCLTESIERESDKKRLTSLLGLWLIAVLFIHAHHWMKAYESGLTGKKMAFQAIEISHGTPERVYLITVDDGYPKYSSFCVIPHEAFGWGIAVKYHTHYEWPHEIKDTCINISHINDARQLADKAYQEGYDCVWLTQGKEVKLIEKK